MKTLKSQIILHRELEEELALTMSSLEPGGLYRDTTFADNQGSLLLGFDPERNRGEWKDIRWAPLSQIVGGQTRVLDNISPDHITVGRAAMPDFLNALGIISLRPDLLRELFEVVDASRGIFGLWIFVDGAWRLTLVDTLFPVVFAGEKPRFAFTTSTGGGVWPMVVEKCLAKAYKSYYRLLYPSLVAGIQSLTGLPSERLSMADRQGFLDRVSAALSARQLIVCREDVSEVKLFLVDDLYVDSSAGIELLRVRKGYWNFRNGQWNGDWSRNSGRWTPELRQKLGYNGSDLSYFWISCDDFDKLFRDVYLYKYNEGYFFNSVSAPRRPVERAGASGVHAFKLVFEREAHCLISVFQSDPRFHSKNYSLSFVRVSLAKIGPLGLEAVEFRLSRQPFCTLELRGDGQYLLLVEPLWSCEEAPGLTLSLYASAFVWAEEQPLTSRAEFSALEIAFWTSYCEKKPGKLFDHGTSQLVDHQIIRKEFADEECGLLCFYLKNTNPSFSVLQNFDIELEGYDSPNKVDNGTLEAIIPPNAGYVLLFKQVPSSPHCRVALKIVKAGLCVVGPFEDFSIISKIATRNIERSRKTAANFLGFGSDPAGSLPALPPSLNHSAPPPSSASKKSPCQLF